MSACVLLLTNCNVKCCFSFSICTESSHHLGGRRQRDKLNMNTVKRIIHASWQTNVQLEKGQRDAHHLYVDTNGSKRKTWMNQHQEFDGNATIKRHLKSKRSPIQFLWPWITYKRIEVQRSVVSIDLEWIEQSFHVVLERKTRTIIGRWWRRGNSPLSFSKRIWSYSSRIFSSRSLSRRAQIRLTCFKVNRWGWFDRVSVSSSLPSEETALTPTTPVGELVFTWWRRWRRRTSSLIRINSASEEREQFRVREDSLSRLTGGQHGLNIREYLWFSGVAGRARWRRWWNDGHGKTSPLTFWWRRSGTRFERIRRTVAIVSKRTFQCHTWSHVRLMRREKWREENEIDDDETTNKQTTSGLNQVSQVKCNAPISWRDQSRTLSTYVARGASIAISDRFNSLANGKPFSTIEGAHFRFVKHVEALLFVNFC